MIRGTDATSEKVPLHYSEKQSAGLMNGHLYVAMLVFVNPSATFGTEKFLSHTGGRALAFECKAYIDAFFLFCLLLFLVWEP